METEALAFGKLTDTWRERMVKLGDKYVGHVHEDYRLQQARIESLLRQRLSSSTFYDDILDFGCGWGRFAPFWGEFAGHVWGVDIMPEALEKARLRIPNVTPLRSSWPVKLPLPDESIDLLWICFTLQALKDQVLLKATCAELCRVMKKRARVLIIDNGGVHQPVFLANCLSLSSGWQQGRVTVNSKPNDHWLIDGFKG